jgi:1,2-diacylglycerol 3-beta-galactosyltransferase
LERRIDFICIDAGGGHRAAATALAEVIRRQGRPWDVQLLCIQDLLYSIDFIRKSVGIPFQDVYNIMPRRGWTRGTARMVPVMHLAIRLSHRAQVQVLTRHWAAHRPDVVVSLIPHYNRALKEALDQAWPGTPFVTILTDIADCPPKRIPMFVEGFTKAIPHYMALADFFIGKPGPGCLSEALAMGLPVIVERNARTLAHERYNTNWIEEQGVGMVVRNFSQIHAAVDELLAPERYRRRRERISATRNTAVYEIPAALANILAGCGDRLENATRRG